MAIENHAAASQAAPQGLAVLMAMVQVVLKCYHSTAYQSHNYGSFVLKFINDNNVTRINNPAKFGWDRISDGAPRSGEISGLRAFYYFFFFPSHAYSPYP